VVQSITHPSVSTRRNIFIFHLGALGDFVLTWPLAVGLSRVLAQHRIIYVTHSQKGKLAEKVLGVESTDIEASWHSLFGDSAAVTDSIAAKLRSSQFIFSFLSKPDDRWTENVRSISDGAHVVHLENRPAPGYGKHHSQWLLEQLQPLPLAASAVAQMVESIQSRGLKVAAHKRTDVLIHPGSGGASKCWPIQRFVELADRVKGAGKSVEFVVGEVERERFTTAELDALGAAFVVHEPQTLCDLHATIETAAAFVCNDSGPGHLAAMCGVATVVLFGPSDPTVWRPLGPTVRVVKSDNLERLPVDVVYNHVRGVLDADQ
jgi:ADP-heptose:LPS heptosyltransferase